MITDEDNGVSGGQRHAIRRIIIDVQLLGSVQGGFQQPPIPQVEPVADIDRLTAGDVLRPDHDSALCPCAGIGAVAGFGDGEGRGVRTVLAQAEGAGGGV